jgi:hypothetical protein
MSTTKDRHLIESCRLFDRHFIESRHLLAWARAILTRGESVPPQGEGGALRRTFAQSRQLEIIAWFPSSFFLFTLFIVYLLSFIVYSLLFIIYRLSFIIYRLSFIVYCLSFIFYHLSFIVYHL